MDLLNLVDVDQRNELAHPEGSPGKLLYKLLSGEKSLRDGGAHEDAAAFGGNAELVLAVLGRKRAAEAFDYITSMPDRSTAFGRYARDPELVDWSALSHIAREFFK